MFAAYLAYNLVEDVDIYVDQGVTSQGLKTLYPDIVILQSGVIKQIFDIKMDLGWIPLLNSVKKTMNKLYSLEEYRPNQGWSFKEITEVKLMI